MFNEEIMHEYQSRITRDIYNQSVTKTQTILKGENRKKKTTTTKQLNINVKTKLIGQLIKYCE